MTHMRKSLNILLFIVFSLIIASAVAYRDYIKFNEKFFVLDMEASTTGVADLFFDTGSGHRDYERLSIHPKAFFTYKFPLPAANIKSFRFDPINVTAVVRIKNARIENGLSDILRKFPPQSFTPALQIASIDASQDILTIRTDENANDPILVIEHSSLNNQQLGWGSFLSQRWWIYIGYALLAFLIVMLLAFVFRRAS